MNLQEDYNQLTSMIDQSLQNSNLELEVLIKSDISNSLFMKCLKKIKGIKSIKYENTIEMLDIFFDDYRMEIYNQDNIRKYCKSESIKGIDMRYIKFITKKPVRNRFIKNYNIKFNLKQEIYIPKGNVNIMENLNRWNELKKKYRYKKRYIFVSDDNQFRFDFTIVKSSEKEEVRSNSTKKLKSQVKDYMKKYVIKPEYIVDFNSWYEKLKPNDTVELIGKMNSVMVGHKSIKSAKVFTNPEEYEIEIEFIGNKMRSRMNSQDILNKYITNIGYLLQTIQNNYFIISEKEKAMVRDKYKQLMSEYNFKAPQSVTLDIGNVNECSYSEYNNIVSIRRGYSVTDKADGERNLLITNDKGDAFLLNRKNEIKSLSCEIEGLTNTILDGEYILKDKDGNNICLFMVFDIYIYREEDVRNRILMRSEEDKEKGVETSRLELINEIFDELNVINNNVGSPLKILKKKFFFGDIHNFDNKINLQLEDLQKGIDNGDEDSEELKRNIKSFKYDTKIFNECKKVYNKEYIYHIDGLIFTPIELAVGQSFNKGSKYSYGGRWQELFKWKPVEENSIDFLVKIKKDENGDDIIGYRLMNGKSMMYKTLVLMVGYDPKIHTKHNSFRVMNENTIYEEKYTMVAFQPTNPHVMNLQYADIKLDNGLLKCDDGSIITDECIVECSYNNNDTGIGKWTAMRVRQINKPNDFTTAINVWKTINHPITTKMITSGDIKLSENVYYKKKEVRSTSITKSLGDFHSYIKKNLIKDNSVKGGILFDLGCGRGGDLNHWLNTELKMVIGVDYYMDNLDSENGFCNRVLNAYNNSNSELLDNILVLAGDVGKDLINPPYDGGINILSKYYLDIIYGRLDLKDISSSKLKKFHSVCKNGVDVVSIQFAVHYMFNNKNTLEVFIKNVANSLKSGGKFIGTCLDGSKVFKMLEDNNVLSEYSDGKLLWKITKKYDTKLFSSDSNSLGNKIDVYFNSIGQTIGEYLVNFDYLTKICKENKLELVDLDPFEKLFNKNLKYGNASKMIRELKTYSFLNSQFIFKKM